MKSMCKKGFSDSPILLAVREVCGLRNLLAVGKKALCLRTRGRDHKVKTNADASVKNTG